jgi:C4-type Zn-finger protein
MGDADRHTTCPTCGGTLRSDEAQPRAFFADGTVASTVRVCEQCGRWWDLPVRSTQLVELFDVKFPEG